MADRCHREPQISCASCNLAQLCLPFALDTADIDRLDAIIRRSRPLRMGETVYRGGDPFRAIYAVRAGTLKAYTVAGDSTEQVVGFYFPGEIFGLDGIGHDAYTSSAVALETAAICEIPFERLGDLSARLPNLQHHFLQLMSREIAQDQQLITLLGKNTAEQRLASLLLSISTRHARRKRSATAFRLPMSRADIANYLGLTVETVSRVFGRFQKAGLLHVDNREIELLQPDQLHGIAAG